MTREEEIINAANEYVTKTHSPSINEFQTAMNIAVLKAYIAAAKWADEHPQFNKETFIEKACWWLRETAHFYVSDFTGELDDNGLIEDFKKAMEEE